ncbi:threonine-phosphate decarboxylase [Tabrizicola sp. WMC-M-20]|nr:threonine-phosphate decarboxylase [Tabrizicola sp. WMC-M-20]
MTVGEDHGGEDHGGQDHGGNIDAAIARFGAGDWIDLSTGINRRAYPLPTLTQDAWRGLPTHSAQAGLVAAAAAAWGAAPGLAGLALGGAQAAIQMVPRLRPAATAGVLVPTYNEHAACLRACGWDVQGCHALDDLAGADLAVVVNPNNPDGRCWSAEALIGLAGRVGLLVVDESFADAQPALSLLPFACPANILILRSFGKFYGLAGLRLGFAFGAPPLIDALARMAGPWPVAGPAIEIGRAALADTAWADAMRVQLSADAMRADRLAQGAGWACVGGTALFRLYDTPDATAARDRLARHHIWSRIFPYSPRWLRLGLPGPEDEWQRLTAALA